MARLESLRLTDFSGGINTFKSDFEIEDNQLVIAQNVLVERRAIIKRKGYTKLTSSPIASAPVLSLYEYYKESTGNTYLLANCDTKVVEINTSDGSVSDVVTGLTAGKVMSYATINDLVYMSNGVDDVYKWDGTTATALSSLKKAKFLIVHKDRLFYVATTANPNTVYFSDAGTPETIGSDNYFIVYTTDGDILTGVVSLYGALWLFKNNSAHQLLGATEDDFKMNSNLINAYPKTGCVSQRSIAHVLGGVIFLGDDLKQGFGVYHLDGVRLREISQNVSDFLKEIARTNRDNAVGVWDGAHYRLAFPVGSETNPSCQLIYHFASGGWTEFTYGMNCLCATRDGSLYGGGSDGHIYKLDTGTSDDGDSIQLRVKTKVFDFNAPHLLKSLRRAAIEFSDVSGEVTINTIMDRAVVSWGKRVNPDTVGGVWGEDNWATDSGTVSVTNGSATVVSSGDYWDNVKKGDSFQVDGDDTVYTVDSVNTGVSPHELTLTQNYQGDTASGKTYVIWNDDTMIWAEIAANRQRFSFDKRCKGRNMQFEFVEDAADSKVEIYGFQARFAVLRGEK